MTQLDKRFYRFGRFTVNVYEQMLLDDKTPVDISDKTFETLVTLIERRDNPVSRDELMKLLWPHGIVGDNNLDKQISQLRGIFGDRFRNKHRHIETIPRLGYHFVAEIEEWTENEEPVSEPMIVKPDEETVDISPEKTDAIRNVRWWLWLGIGLSTAGLAVALFIALKPAPKPEIPEISTIIPATPLATIADQSIILFGRNFQNDSTVKITFPSGGSVILKEAQIRPATKTSMAILVDFNCHPGKYKLEVINPDGQTSAPFSFNALKHFQSPIIEAIVPESPKASKEEQSIVLYGHNFGHAVMVEVIFPDGRSSTLQGLQILQRMPTAITLSVLFDGNPGTYKIRARNPDGDWSAPFPLIAH